MGDSGIGPVRGDVVDQRRAFRLLVVGSLVCGAAAFAASLVASQLLTSAVDSAAVVGPEVLLCMGLFTVFLTACIVLGYAAARRRPRVDP